MLAWWVSDVPADAPARTWPYVVGGIALLGAALPALIEPIDSHPTSSITALVVTGPLFGLAAYWFSATPYGFLWWAGVATPAGYALLAILQMIV